MSVYLQGVMVRIDLRDRSVLSKHTLAEGL